MEDFAIGVCLAIIIIKTLELFVPFWWAIALGIVPYFAVMSLVT